MAETGDILIFQNETNISQPFHTMIYLGKELGLKYDDYIVYHTGYDSLTRDTGIIKLIRFQDLLSHPNKNWIPIKENKYFKGFYRWKILN